MTLMSQKSGTLNFYKVCRLFRVARIQKGNAFLAVLSFKFVSFLILSDNYHPVFYRSKSGLKSFLIGCPIRDN